MTSKQPEVGSASSSISGVSPMTSHDRLPHCDTENWYLAVGRDAAEELLAGKPQGTFLIRPSSDGQHALSIMCSGRVGHCKIFQVSTIDHIKSCYIRFYSKVTKDLPDKLERFCFVGSISASKVYF